MSNKLKQPKKQKETVEEVQTVEEAVSRFNESKNEIIENFAKAYLAETGLLPSEVELVTVQKVEDGNLVNIAYFRKKG